MCVETKLSKIRYNIRHKIKWHRITYNDSHTYLQTYAQKAIIFTIFLCIHFMLYLVYFSKKITSLSEFLSARV